MARVEAEHAEGESEGIAVFDRTTVGGGFRPAEGEVREVPFTLALPWETPITELYGQALGSVLGVRTELAVAVGAAGLAVGVVRGMVVAEVGDEVGGLLRGRGGERGEAEG